MSMLDVNAALVQAYRDMGFSLPTGYETRDFAPPANSAWAAVFNMPASRSPDTMGDGGDDLYSGLMQIDFHSVQNSGTAILLNYADSVVNFLPAGKRVSYNGQDVRIRRVVPSPIRKTEGGSGYVISLSVYWEAWIARPVIGP